MSRPPDVGVGVVTDRLGRPLRDLRVSVTDRCNFRCSYCLPRDAAGGGPVFVPRAQLLSFEEITRLVGAFTTLGVTKIRLTGGEPLLRRGLADLVARIAALPGVQDLALTTNGSLLAAQAQGLRDAGLHRLTVSLDSLDPVQFGELADAAVSLDTVLAGITAATAAGFGPVKLNMVLRRGRNEDALIGLVDFARRHGHVLRVIEFMDVGTTNGWDLGEVVPAAQVLARVGAVWPLEPIPGVPGQVAERYRFRDGAGELGVIASVTRPFCGDCSRARVTATGELFTCLFGAHGLDLRSLLRSDIGDDVLQTTLRGHWRGREDRYSELRAQLTGRPDPGAGPGRAEMSYLGG